MSSSLSEACSASTFDPITVFGAKVLNIEANLVTNYSSSVPEGYRYVDPAVELSNANFCNVSIEYTHPGQDDHVFVETWLPIEDWNGRLQALGGGGYQARYAFTDMGMVGALADGFAAVGSNAGLGNSTEATPWALLSPGNVNLYKLQNLASVALQDQVCCRYQVAQLSCLSLSN